MHLEDLEVIEIENNIEQLKYVDLAAKKEDAQALSMSKQMLDKILERPSLSELIQKTIEKQDRQAQEKA